LDGDLAFYQEREDDMKKLLIGLGTLFLSFSVLSVSNAYQIEIETDSGWVLTPDSQYTSLMLHDFSSQYTYNPISDTNLSVDISIQAYDQDMESDPNDSAAHITQIGPDGKWIWNGSWKIGELSSNTFSVPSESLYVFNDGIVTLSVDKGPSLTEPHGDFMIRSIVNITAERAPSVTTTESYLTDYLTLGDTFSFDYWWEMGVEPTDGNFDILFFNGTEWETFGWELNFDGSSDGWESASFYVPEWARGKDVQIMFSLFDWGQVTDPTVYLRNIGSAPVPEPATIFLLGTGLIGLVAGSSKKRFGK
jgi:hypothetical protein